MLYYIDKSCVEALEEGNKIAAEFLEQLVIHRRKCKNMLIATRKVFTDLSKSERLSDFARAYFKILRNRSSEYKLILQEAPKYYKVVSEYSGAKQIVENGQECILLSLKEGNEADFTDKSILLVESNDDIEFYAFIGKFYLKSKGICHMDISFDSQIGGGDTTGPRLEEIVKEAKRTCLCIADSDKKFCSDQCGETLNKILKIVKRYEPINYEAYALQMHEIENLIPVEVLDNICKSIPDADRGIEFLKFLLNEDKTVSSPVYYFDYKNGIPKDYFYLKTNCTEDEKKKFNRREGYRKYWGDFLQKYGVKLDENLGTPIIPGICGKILKHTIQYFKDYWEEDNLFEKISNSYICETWLEVGARIAAWGCVGKRMQ